MIFLLDENFPKAATGILVRLGHTVGDVRKSGLSGAPDNRVLQEAMNLGAVILSTDRDFFHSLGPRYPSHPGIVVIALRQPSRSAILKRLEWFLSNVPEELWVGRVFQLRDNSWLARPPIAERGHQG